MLQTGLQKDNSGQLPLLFTHRGCRVYFNPFSRTVRIDNQGIPCPETDIKIDLLDSPLHSLEPFIVFLILSPFCNMECKYCIIHHGQYIESRHLMDPETIDKAIEWVFASAAGNTRAINFDLFGGEPLLNPAGILRAVKKIHELMAATGFDARILLVTNLTLLDEEMARFLAEHNVLVQVSIDGPEHIHDRYRTFKDGTGSFSRVMAGLDLLGKYVPISNIIARPTLTEGVSALEIYEYFWDMGIRNFSLIPLKGCHSYKLSNESFYRDIDLVMEKYADAVGRGIFLRVEPLSSYLRALYEFFGAKSQGRYMDCGAALDLFAVAPNGDIYPCQNLASDPAYYADNIGNVYSGLDQSKIESFQESTGARIPEGCKKCPWHPFCDRGCKMDRLLDKEESNCCIGEGWLPYLWKTCLFWYAHLRDTEPGILLKMVDGKTSEAIDIK